MIIIIFKDNQKIHIYNMSLHVVVGSMNSGKSAELNKLYQKYSLKYNVICINHKINTRDGTFIRSKNGTKTNCIVLENICDLIKINKYKDAKFIFIDEAHFFKNLILFLDEELNNKKIMKHFYIFGLDSDYKQNCDFPTDLSKLVKKSDSFTKLTAVCSLCEDIKSAPFTARKYSINKTSDNISEDVIDIGFEQYISLCRKCYNNKTLDGILLPSIKS